MGVGNYKGKFEQVGKAFSFEPSYIDDEAFEKHRAAYLHDYGDEYVGTLVQFRQEVYETEWDDLKDTLRHALAGRFGFHVADPGESAYFDDDFQRIVSSSLVEVGIHDYHGSYVVGVAPTGDGLTWTLEPDAYEVDIANAYAMRSGEYADASAALAEKIGDYVRSVVQGMGNAVTFRETAWTSGTYPRKTSEELAIEQSDLLREIEPMVAALERGPSLQAMHGNDGLRKEMFRIHDENLRTPKDFSAVVFLYDAADRKVVAFDPSEGCRIHADFPSAPDDLLASLSGIADEGLYDLPAGEATDAYMLAVAKRFEGSDGDWYVPVSRAEYEEWTDSSLSVSYDDMIYDFGDETPSETQTLLPHP